MAESESRSTLGMELSSPRYQDWKKKTHKKTEIMVSDMLGAFSFLQINAVIMNMRNQKQEINKSF